MVAQQPRTRLRDAPAQHPPARYRQPVAPPEFASVKPLPPPPTGPEADPELSGADSASSASESRTERQKVHRTGTPPGHTSLVVAGKVYHVADIPNNPGLQSELEDTTSLSHVPSTMPGESVVLASDGSYTASSLFPSRKKQRSKMKARSLAVPPALSSPVPFPQDSALDGNLDAYIDTPFETQQARASPFLSSGQHSDHLEIDADDAGNIAVHRTPSPAPSPSPPLRDPKFALLRRFRSRKSRNHRPPSPVFTDTGVEHPVTGPDEEGRGRARKMSLTRGLTRSLSGAYRSVKSGVERRISLRRAESTARRADGRTDSDRKSPGPNIGGDAVLNIVERIRRNCTRAQLGFNSGLANSSRKSVLDVSDRKVTPDDLPPQWHIAFKRDVDDLLLNFAGGNINARLTGPETDHITQARALAYIADLSATVPLARDCFLQLNVNHPLDNILKLHSGSHHRAQRSEIDVEVSEYDDMKRGRLTASHSGRRHWTTVEALVKRCKACLEVETEVSRMCRMLDGSLPLSEAEGDLGLKLKVISMEDALIGVIGYLRSATYAYPTTLQLRELLELKYPRQVCVGEATWAVLYATLCDAIALFRPDPNLAVNSIALSRDTSVVTEDADAETQQDHDENESRGSQVHMVNGQNQEREDHRDKIFVDALHLRALDALLCAALETPATLSSVYISASSRHRDRSGKKEVGPSQYVKLVRLLVSDDIKLLYPLASNKAETFVKARLDKI